jgi:hypothetical protein
MLMLETGIKLVRLQDQFSHLNLPHRPFRYEVELFFSIFVQFF